jgi:hypothetical protein
MVKLKRMRLGRAYRTQGGEKENAYIESFGLKVTRKRQLE